MQSQDLRLPTKSARSRHLLDDMRQLISTKKEILFLLTDRSVRPSRGLKDLPELASYTTLIVVVLGTDLVDSDVDGSPSAVHDHVAGACRGRF